MSRIQKRLSEEEAQFLGLEKRMGNSHGNPKYTLTDEQFIKLVEYRGLDKEKSITTQSEDGYSESITETDAFKQYCKENDVPIDRVKSVKVVQHTGSTFYNIVLDYNKNTDIISEEAIEKIITKNFDRVFKTPELKIHTKLLRVIITDAHIAMNPNDVGYSLYGGKWDKTELFDRLSILIEEISLLKDNYDEIHIVDLGDYLDGWNGETVRKGHHLPQNMTNEEAFENGVEFKMVLLNQLSKWFANVQMHNICNDNHAGDFGKITNNSVKRLAEATLGNVSVFNYNKFINHYFWQNKVFVLSHGKDDKHLKFGFKPQIDQKGIAKIEEYMKVNKLMGRGYDVIFEKGDSHQQLFDFDCSDEFDYFNYRALSPSSEWVQTNFKRGSSGFTIMEVEDDKVKTTLIKFKWKD